MTIDKPMRGGGITIAASLIFGETIHKVEKNV